MVAIILLFIAVYEHFKPSRTKLLTILGLFTVLSALYFVDELLIGYYVIFSDDEVSNVLGGVRLQDQSYFFTNLSFGSVFFGYPDDTVFASHINSELYYTYNVAIDIWNRYGIFGILLVVCVGLLRIVNHKKYFFPLYYFLPPLAYSTVESIFFPNFWDCFVLLLIFTPKTRTWSKC